MIKKIVTPSSILIEKTALEMAATFYEVGRSQGLVSRHKNARHYAAANIEKFIPRAVIHLRQLLYDSNTPDDMRMLIHEAILERINDQDATNLADAAKDKLPDIDISKLIPVKELPPVIADHRRFIDKRR